MFRNIFHLLVIVCLINSGTADVDNLLTFNVSVADNYVQFRMIQLEHGGGECDCWNITADLLSNGHLSIFGLE